MKEIKIILNNDMETCFDKQFSILIDGKELENVDKFTLTAKAFTGEELRKGGYSKLTGGTDVSKLGILGRYLSNIGSNGQATYQGAFETEYIEQQISAYKNYQKQIAELDKEYDNVYIATHCSLPTKMHQSPKLL